MPGRVLLVSTGQDDVSHVENLLKSVLFEVRVVRNPRRVDSEIIGFQPDCVITRITPKTLPHMQALRLVFQRLRQNWLGWTTETGIAPTQLWNLGVSEAISDPFIDDILVLRVRNLVRYSHVLEDLRLRAYPGGGFGRGADPVVPLDRKVLFATPDTALFDNVRTQMARQGIDASLMHCTDPTIADYIEQDTPDVVVVDETLLPAKRRLIVLAQLRATRALRGTELVILAKHLDPYRQSLVDLGACDFDTLDTPAAQLALRIALPLRRRQQVEHFSDRISQTLSLAMVDPLTGLNNRRYLTQHLATLIARSRQGKDHISVAMLDIDHFKRINDAHGHLAGDQFLCAIAARIRDCVRSHDLLARFGGEEFALVMPDTPIEQAMKIAERIHSDIAGVNTCADLPKLDTPLTVSIGVAAADLQSTVAEHALGPADQALFAAKRAGRNTVQTVLPAV